MKSNKLVLEKIKKYPRLRCTIPDGKKGDWAVETFTVSAEQAKMYNLRCIFGDLNNTRLIRPGVYKRLTYQGRVIMSDTPLELRDHEEVIRRAKKGGHILVNGLGLGIVLSIILENKEIRSVTVIEKNIEVIELVGSFFLDSRLKIINADAFTWQPPKKAHYSVVWHDIWEGINEENLPEMIKLHRKYSRRTDWQGSWCRKSCVRLRALSKKEYF